MAPSDDRQVPIETKVALVEQRLHLLEQLLHADQAFRTECTDRLTRIEVQLENVIKWVSREQDQSRLVVKTYVVPFLVAIFAASCAAIGSVLIHR